jgi:ABC-type glutathione transport system ATPase component
MGFARDVADRICFIEGGRILEQGKPERIFTAPEHPRTRQFLGRIIEAGRLLSTLLREPRRQESDVSYFLGNGDGVQKVVRTTLMGQPMRKELRAPTICGAFVWGTRNDPKVVARGS